MKLKVCGMKHNIAEVAQLIPDYLGFIFYKKSPRSFDAQLPSLPKEIKKVGVFVDAEIDFVLKMVSKYNLDVVQLHGDENEKYCLKLKSLLPANPNLLDKFEQLDLTENIEDNNIQIWKVFSIKDEFDFSVLESYEPYVDQFLFDTKGKERGGNGYTFDWSVLHEYPSKKPFILSGGIGLDALNKLEKINTTSLPLFAVDVNSKFETQPGLKNIEDLKTFKEKLCAIT